MNERGNLLVSYQAEGEGVRTAVYSSGTLSDLLGYDINNLGEVAGVADDRVVLYADGEVIDLNTLIHPEADL